MSKASVYERVVPCQCCLTFETKTPDFKSVWHTHQEFEIVCVESGFGNFHYGDKKQAYEADDLLIIGPWVAHIFVEKSNNHKSTSILFGHDFIVPGFFFSDLAVEIKSFLDKASSGLILPKGRLILEKEIESLLALDVGLDQAMHMLLLLKQLAMQTNYKKMLEEPGNIKNKKYVLIQEILYHIHTNFHQKQTQDDLAKLFCVSRSTFARFFHEKTGKTFNQYLSDIRVQQACKLLESTDQQITEIGFQVGFESISSFNRAFVQVKHLSPRAYRKELRQVFREKLKIYSV